MTSGRVHLETGHQWPWRWDSMESKQRKSERSGSGGELVGK